MRGLHCHPDLGTPYLPICIYIEIPRFLLFFLFYFNLLLIYFIFNFIFIFKSHSQSVFASISKFRHFFYFLYNFN